MVHIITDSTSDISSERAAQLGIEVLPLTVNFGQESYRDGVDISIEEFYKKLEEAQTLPFTSQINPNEFEEAFNRCIKRGEEVLYVGISTKLSGTCQSAYLARETIGSDMIHIVDTEAVAFTLELLVGEAVKLREKGLTAGEIAAEIEGLKKRVVLIAGVETLKYLKMGGRLSATSAAVGGILNIRPIISVIDGKVVSIGKVRGRKAVFKQMLKQIEKDGVDSDYPFCFGHSNSPEALKACMDFFTPYIDGDNLIIAKIGCVVGTHAGPGAVGIGYIKKQTN